MTEYFLRLEVVEETLRYLDGVVAVMLEWKSVGDASFVGCTTIKRLCWCGLEEEEDSSWVGFLRGRRMLFSLSGESMRRESLG